MKKTLIPLIVTVMSLSACTINISKSEREGKTQQNIMDMPAEASSTYIQSYTLKDGSSLIVEEGRLEPRSLGSITVKLYRNLDVGDFASAISFPRDGTITQSKLLNRNGREALSITTTTSGSGNYQNMQLVCVKNAVLSLC